MTAEELYQKEFGNADSVPKESVIRLLKHFAKVIKIEREQALRIHYVVGRSEQLKALEDLKDFADAIEKVVENISDLRDSNLSSDPGHEVYDAIKAIDENV